MKPLIGISLILGLVVGSVATADAAKKKPAPVEFFFHGTEAIGEIDLVNNFGAAYNKMDTTEPDGDVPKSITGLTWAEDPQMWNDCAGMYTLPVWTGPLSGRIVGDMKLTLHTISVGRPMTVEIWPDIATQTCASNDLSEGTYPEPAAMARIDIPPGHSTVEYTFEDVNIKAVGSLLIQFTSVGPAAARILYDSPDLASSLSFKCIPARGKSCVP